MALTPEQQARLNAGAVVASGLIASPDWWMTQNARKRQNPGGPPYQEVLALDALIIVDAIEALVVGDGPGAPP